LPYLTSNEIVTRTALALRERDAEYASGVARCADALTVMERLRDGTAAPARTGDPQIHNLVL
jgi:hypothetical protein